MKIAKTKVSFPIRLAVFQARGAARMKLHIVRTANRRVSFLIRLAVFLASGAACMKFHQEIFNRQYSIPVYPG